MGDVRNPADLPGHTAAGDAHHDEAHAVASHDTTATGAELDTLTDGSETALHSHAPSGAVTREGGNTTEATTTSTSTVNLLTAASLTIAATQFFLGIARLRKTAGAADYAQVNFRFNATSLMGAHIWSRSTNAPGDSMLQMGAGARLANYLTSGRWGITTAAGASTGFLDAGSSNLPTVEVTDVIVIGWVHDANITMGADELQIYSFAAS